MKSLREPTKPQKVMWNIPCKISIREIFPCHFGPYLNIPKLSKFGYFLFAQ